MGARPRSWRQRIEQHPVRLAVIVGTAMFGIALLVVLVLGYIFNWGWTGIGPYIPPTKDSNFQRGKTLWDWLQLLIVPLVLAAGGYLFNLAMSRNEQWNTRENQRETALQAYIDRMSELLLHQHLLTSSEEEEVRDVARIQTLTVLSRLDGKRKGSVLLFLGESGLIKSYVHSEQGRIVNLGAAGLYGADFSGVDVSEIYRPYLGDIDVSYAIFDNAHLTEVHLERSTFEGTRFIGADLSQANLSSGILIFANLSKANLTGANLTQSDLMRAKLEKANLTGADLTDADLSDANLTGAIVTDEQLAKTETLKGAIMPDGSIHP